MIPRFAVSQVSLYPVLAGVELCRRDERDGWDGCRILCKLNPTIFNLVKGHLSLETISSDLCSLNTTVPTKTTT
jgi:hypothetical protein